MEVEGYDWKRIAIWLLAGILIIYALVWIYGYLTSGRIAVKTSNNSSIVKIVRVANQETKPFSQQANGSKTFRVKPGTYTVSVFQNGGTYGASKTISVKARQKITVSLNPSRTVGAEPVLGQAAAALFADNSRLVFLDATTNNLKQIDADGNLTTLFADHQFSGIQWDNLGQAVAQTTDNKLFFIDGGSLSQLSLPFVPKNNQIIGYDISPSGQVYVSNGGNIYKQTESGFDKIYSVSGKAAKLFASDHTLAVIGLGEREGANSLLTIGDSGSVAKRSLDVTQAAWSPDGKFLAVNSRSNYLILDTSLKQFRSFSAPQSSAIAWKDSSSVVYNIANQLWSYNTLSSESNQLVLLGAGNYVNANAIFLNQARDYVYFSTTSATKSSLFRAALHRQSYNISLNALSSFLPKDVGVCSLDYVNFMKPVITVEYPQLETDPALCVKAARGQMSYFGLNPNSFRYTVTAKSGETADNTVKGE